MAKYNVGQEVMKEYENLQIVCSQIFKYLFIFDHIKKYSVYWYSDLTNLISDKKVFGPIQLFELLGLYFDKL
jgi:hypothetical protein